MGLPIEEADYWVRYIELPPKVYAYLHSNGDGTFLIFLDPRRSWEQQLNDYEHELWHIVRDDFWNGLPIQVVEAA